ncbi:hypothetical protein [uncultured Fibrella sp.]|uniref:hypothetical protein n=1 Tax=uncultured Fibrella sp. TaxID=1284596 RepID=UPI0035CAAB73
MYRFFLLLFLSISTIACEFRQQFFSEEELLRMVNSKMLGEDGTLRRSLSDIWVNTAAFCQSEQAVDCVVELDHLQHKLNDLNPIPVPQSDSAKPISAEKATVLYKEFVNAHKGEPLLAVFQQLYPRILLTKYGIIESNDYGLIAYFATEMAKSNALDFPLRTRLLPLLKGHIPTDQYAKLVDSTLESAKNEAKRQQKEVTRLNSLIALNPAEFSPSDPDTYLTASHRRLVEQYEHSQISATITQLTQWQEALTD